MFKNNKVLFGFPSHYIYIYIYIYNNPTLYLHALQYINSDYLY